MASEITLKYLHPSIKTYITTENYQFDTSASNELLFVADVFEHGKDNELQQVNTVSEYLFKYGEPNFAKFGQAGYNVEKWLTNGGSAVIMRLLPEDASFAHAVLNIQYKNSTKGKTVLSSNGDETKINDVYLRPLVSYIGVNNTSEPLIESELKEDRSGYPTTDGYIDNFIFAVYPEGRGEYYNDFGFRIRLNPSYDTTLTSRVYTFEVIKFTGTTYDIIDGPYYVTFDPDAIDPNSQRSMFIENVVNSYSNYVKVKFNTENYLKLASVINDNVDPYIIDIISGKSRILDDGNKETYFSPETGKDEDVHISLHSYSSTGIKLTNNGEDILNISNNDQTMKDIVDIADNSRRVIYNNQKYVTDYMRTFYNWLLIDRVSLNLEKILKVKGTIESDIDDMSGLLKDKAANLIYNNITDDEAISYPYAGLIHDSSDVGKYGRNNAWYLKAQETIDPGRKDGFEVNSSGEPDDVYISTAEMMQTITEDGFISDTNEHLISYYNNFKKYFQFISNYDIYNNTNFVGGNKFQPIKSKKFSENTTISKIYRKSKNNGTERIISIPGENKDTISTLIDFVKGNSFAIENTDPNDILLVKNSEGGLSILKPEYIDLETYGGTNTIFYFDENCNYYRPVLDTTLYNENGLEDINGKYVKVYDFNGEPVFMNSNNLLTNLYFVETRAIGGSGESGDTSIDSTGSHVVIEFRNDDYVGTGVNGLTLKYPMERYISGFDSNKFKWSPDDYFNSGFGSLKIYAYNKLLTESNYIDLSSIVSPSWTTNGIGTHPYLDYQFIYKLVKAVGEKNANLNDWVFVCFFSNDKTKFISIKDKFGAGNEPLNWKQLTTDVNKDRYSVIFLENILKDLNEIYNYNTDYYKTKYLTANAGYDKQYAYQFYISSLSFKIINSLFVKAKDNIKITKDSKTGKDIPSDGVDEYLNIAKIGNVKYYFSNIGVTTSFNPIFDEYIKNGALTRAFNKVSSYAALISKELDGKGKDTIVDIDTIKNNNKLDYSDYSLTTIFNFLVGGFESIVNNQGSITDYSNYASLKYLMKSINNNLDLRSTYLTILNVHKNTILDLSTELAKTNASAILGEETLNELYAAMDKIVVETNYLINNVITTLLNDTYTIKNLDTMYRVDNNKPYAYYFNDNQELTINGIDPLGVKLNIDKYGIVNDNSIEFYGVLPLLEKILINITGENHYGTTIDTIYGGQPLVEIYNDIKEGYRAEGFDQTTYEQMYSVISSALSDLSQIHNIITSFINEKYITEIMNNLLGTIDVDNTVIIYKGKNFTINTLFEYFNEGLDSDLTQNKVIDLINDAINVSANEFLPPYRMESVNPIFLYPYLTMSDISDSITIAKENKDIVKNNIQKQDHVLATLNTLCYDNLTQDVNSVIGFSEGSDGSFTYDPTTSASLKKREHLINDIRIKAYKGTWNPDVLNKDLYEFDHVFDANYEDAVKNAIITLARDERQDFFFWADTKIQNTVQDCIDWKMSFTNSTYFMSIISQAQTWYDEYTSKNIELTSTYILADKLPRHITNYGVHYPLAGSNRGGVGGFLSMDWYPNEEQKETLYKNKVNYIEKDISTIRIGAQNTNYPSGPLGSINNMLVVLKVKRNVEKIAKKYQFEFNTQETRGTMAMEINNYLANWKNNGACTVANAVVYASDYDIIQKIVRVDVTLQFTGVIERIVINIDCPANI